MTAQRYARIAAVAGIATTLGVLAACDSTSNDATATPTPPTESLGTPTAVGARPGGQLPTMELFKATQAVTADLAQQKGIVQSDISVFSTERVEWPDTSLGNPEPGKVYAQMVTSGWRIYLAAKGQKYEYHTNLDGSSLTFVGTSALPANYTPAPQNY